MKIAVFGGTFDPVHRGHLGMARHLLSVGYADRILFLPAFLPPHKAAKKDMTSYEHRRAMLTLSLEPGMELSDMERDRGGISYTFDTLTLLTERGAGNEYLWLIGSDSLAELHLWFRARELVERFSFLTYPRGGKKVPTEAELVTHWGAELARKLLDGVLKNAPEYLETSTDIRRVIRRTGPESAAAYLASGIPEYIRRNRLYTGENRMEEETKQSLKLDSDAIAAFCEQVLYANKAENILRFNLAGFNWAQSDNYIVCTGTSAPHIGALAERIQRELRTAYQLRPSAVDGEPQSQWIVVDFGYVMVHIMTQEARERYQLEALWSDVPVTDAVKRLDAEFQKHAAGKDA